MALAPNGRPLRIPRAVAGGVVAALVLVATAAAFSSASTAAEVARNAEQLHWANAMLGSTDIARLTVAQAVLVDQLTDNAAAREAATTEAEEALDEVQAWAASDARPQSLGDVSSFLAIGRSAVAHTSSGETNSAIEDLLELNQTGNALRAELSDAQVDALDAIEHTEAIAGRISTVLQFLIVVALPLIAFTIYRRRARSEIRDVAMRHEAEMEAERALSSARGDLVAAVSHQFRTPLTVISGFTDLLVADSTLSPDQREMVSLVDQESWNLERMVDDLLEAAKLTARVDDIELEDEDLVSVLENVVAEHAPGVVIEAPASAVMLRTDRDKVAHIVRNLVVNALQHGGPEVRVGLEVSGGDAILEVTDNGPGVPPEIRDRLFEPFVNDAGRALLTGSLGMGLAVAASLATLLGGELGYQRTDRTSFTLRLPAAVERRTEDVLSPEVTTV